jgi:L-alanine-DL-glutamate epimerase-like enolase superfamily enzyme
MQITFRERTLRPRHAFTLSRESIREKRSLFVELVHDGLVGRGEGAPIARYGETPQSCRAALERMRAALPESPVDHGALIASLSDLAPKDHAARAAMDAAIMDWVGKSQGVPLYALWKIDPARMLPTSMTIAIDTPDRVRERAREACGFHVLKLKVGVEQDRAMIGAIRDVTDVKIRADANEGYPDRETALREIEWLAGRNVELIEQPLPAAHLEDTAWLKDRSPLPLIADEAFLLPQDVPNLAEAYHGINVKLVKCGGTLHARQAIQSARSCGLEVMIGCTIESSLGIAAAAHLAPLADYVDLDGNLLLANDPFVGHPIRDGRIGLRDAPGLGIGYPLRGRSANPDVSPIR